MQVLKMRGVKRQRSRHQRRERILEKGNLPAVGDVVEGYIREVRRQEEIRGGHGIETVESPHVYFLFFVFFVFQCCSFPDCARGRWFRVYCEISGV